MFPCAKFAYDEDYLLFAFLVMNRLCEPSDGPVLASLQFSEPAPRELRRLLEVDPKFTNDLLKLSHAFSTPKFRDDLRTYIPTLPGIIANAKGTVAGASVGPSSRTDDLAALLEELRDKRVELGNRDRLLENWADVAVRFLESVEALETNEDVNETYRKATAVVRKAFARSALPLGFSVLIPERGEPFDESQHSIDGIDSHETELPASTVCSCVQWGYRLPNGKVLRAKVIISLARKG